jgi:hypothetical protein
MASAGSGSANASVPCDPKLWPGCAAGLSHVSVQLWSGYLMWREMKYASKTMKRRKKKWKETGVSESYLLT